MNEITPKNNSLNAGVDENISANNKNIKKDISFSYFSERSKKITTAVYIVTNLMPQNDPLRLAIRKASVRILSLIGITVSVHAPAEVSAEIADLAKKISSMLEIAFFSGYISEMNFSVLKTELDIFANEVAGYNGQKTIKREFLSIDVAQDGGLQDGAERPQQTVSYYKGHLQRLPKLVPKKVTIGTPVSRSVPNRGVAETKKNSRKESIISIIKMKGNVAIKDISSVILNCSEKTIQRELTALVAEGTLKRTGDRRWSTYSLAV